MEAVEAVVKLPKTGRDIGEQLSRAHSVEKEHARDMLHFLTWNNFSLRRVEGSVSVRT